MRLNAALRALIVLAACGGIALSCDSTEPLQEYGLCSDGIDGDEDGLIDCDDPDCASDVSCLCGDGQCDIDGGEPSSCPLDCPGICGNGVCDAEDSYETCPADCPNPCGDGECAAGEEATCPADCDMTCFSTGELMNAYNIEGACRTCSTMACACEMEEAELATTMESVEAALACVQLNCQTECNYPMCNSTLSLDYDEAQATCLGTNCCAELTACANEPTCSGCYGGSGTCDPGPVLTAVTDCRTTNMCGS